MTISKILKKYPNLPTKFLVRFALGCANDVKHVGNSLKYRSLSESIQLWLEDKVSESELSMIAFHIAGLYDYQSDSEEEDREMDAAYVTLNITYTICSNDPYYHFSNAITHACMAINIPHDSYDDKFLKAINELTDLEKMIYS